MDGSSGQVPSRSLRRSACSPTIGQSIASGFGRPECPSSSTPIRRRVILGGWRSFLFIALAAGLYLAAERRLVNARALAWGLALIVAIDLWSIDRLLLALLAARVRHLRQ